LQWKREWRGMELNWMMNNPKRGLSPGLKNAHGKNMWKAGVIKWIKIKTRQNIQYIYI
jgi:hypothetical protein